MTEREVNLKAKGPSVNLMVNPVFMEAAPILKTAWLMYGAECVVTSGRDGVHSRQSAHDKGNALDLRTYNLGNKVFVFGPRLAAALVENLGPYWYLVLERDHFHLEVVAPGEAPNIKWFKPGKHFYVQGEK